MKTHFKFAISFVTLVFSQSLWADNVCIKPIEFVSFKKNDKNNIFNIDSRQQGYYQRISPDGRFILKSLSGSSLGMIALVELKSVRDTYEAFPYRTRLTNESFALLSSFQFIVDLGGHHYPLKEIVQKQARAKSVFTAGATGVYAASTEMADSDENSIHIRSIAWPNARANDETQGKGKLTITESHIQKKENKYIVEKEETFALCQNLAKTEGEIFSTPMISITGEELAARPMFPEDKKPSMRIYKIDPKGICTKVDDLKIETEKTIFGWPKDGENAPLIWKDQSGLHLWDRNRSEMFRIYNEEKPFKSIGFPAMTKDGRIVTAAQWTQCKKLILKNQNIDRCSEEFGFVIVDPLQSPDILKYKKLNPKHGMKECILNKEVQKVLSEQKKIYGI